MVADGSDGTLMLPLKLLERKCNLLPFRALFLSLCRRLLGVAIEINRAPAPVYNRRWQAKLSRSCRCDANDCNARRPIEACMREHSSSKKHKPVMRFVAAAAAEESFLRRTYLSQFVCNVAVCVCAPGSCDRSGYPLLLLLLCLVYNGLWW